MKKALAKIQILFILLFGVSLLCGAEGSAKTLKPEEIKISSEYGRVVEAFDAGTTQLVVHMQDAHTNYEAQLNAAHIIEDLIKQHGLYLILVEGGSRDVSLHHYRERDSLEERKKFADKSLKEGVIAGEEYLNIATDYPMKLQGIEDRALYDQNMEAFLEVDKGNKEALMYIGLLSSVAATLKFKIYTKALRQLDEKKEGFRKERIGLNDYVKYLSTTAKSNKIDIIDYQNYRNLAESIELEQGIDFSAVETERAKAIDVVSKKSKADELDILLAKSREFKRGDISAANYHAYLKEFMKKRKIKLNKYPNLDKYILYITTYEKVNSSEVFKEIKKIEAKIQQALIKNEDQRRLAEASSGLDLFTQFINLKLAPDDFDHFLANEGNFDLAAWARLLKAQASKHKLTQAVPENTEVVRKLIPSLKKFYVVARKRDDVFLANTKKYMESEKVDLAVLIAGGFHTPTLMKMFRENNISYIVVSPKVVKPTDEELYHKILTEGWAPSE